MSIPSKISYKSEICRKLIHLSSLWMPISIYYLDRPQSILLFFFALTVLLSFEAIRRLDNSFSSYLRNLFGFILREKETTPGFHLTGAFYMVLAVLICTLFFPVTVTITALSIMLIGDTAASLIGRKWGRRPILDKSLEGSLAFLTFALLTVSALNYLGIYTSDKQLIAALIAACIATFIELISSRIHFDDNFSVTIGAAIIMQICLFL